MTHGIGLGAEISTFTLSGTRVALRSKGTLLLNESAQVHFFLAGGSLPFPQENRKSVGGYSNFII